MSSTLAYSATERAGGSIVSLPLETPWVDTYPRHAYLLAAMQTRAASADWILSNYLQLKAVPAQVQFRGFAVDHVYDFSTPELLWTYIPLFESIQRFHRQFVIELGIDPVDAFRAAIRQGYYVIVPVDKNLLPSSADYGQDCHAQAILIHGFDQDRECFHVAGFFAGPHFARSAVGYGDLRKAYLEMSATKWTPQDAFLFRLYADGDGHEDYPFDPITVRDGLGDYLQSRNSSERERPCRAPEAGVYGVAVYDTFRRYLATVGAAGSSSDVRPVHLFHEHKKLMLRRIEHMVAAGLISADFQRSFVPVVRVSFMLQAAYLKAHISRKEADFAAVAALLDEMVRRERQPLEALHAALR